MQKSKLFGNNMTLIAAALSVFIGFRLATQAGMGMDNQMQNDGYAVTGGLLILMGGIVAGLWVSSKDYKKNG